MIQSLEFVNFRLLRAAKLPLGQCTLLVGANSSGKSTALLGLDAAREPASFSWRSLHTVGKDDAPVSVRINWSGAAAGVSSVFTWEPSGNIKAGVAKAADVANTDAGKLNAWIQSARVFHMSAAAIATSCALREKIEVPRDGNGLVGTLDRLRDQEPERFSRLNDEFQQWFPEFDHLLFDVQDNSKVLRLRLRRNCESLGIENTSDGTRLALALLTIAYLPEPPMLVAIEEPDHGMHPRLLARVQQALYRLAYPKDFGDPRPPVQVLATTHSPLLLDLFKDHPEEVVIAQRDVDGATFMRLVDRPDHEELLSGASLGDIWYSGVLGGVPIGS
jgi:predicted ATPase